MRAVVAVGCAIALGLACFGGNPPSTFQGGDEGGARDGAAGDALGPSDAHLLTGDIYTSTFPCGQINCPGGYYCVMTEHGSVDTGDVCYPLLQCMDCACVSSLVMQAYCSTATVSCSAQGSNLHVTCEEPIDAAAGGGG